MLTMLEEMGHAMVEMDGARKLYAITDAGRAGLAEQKTLVDGLFARMDAARKPKGPGGAQVQRAMQNLMIAMRMKMSSAANSTEQTHAIVDVLDAAAKQIERM